jgi:L-threonylcarbamoyladenylate synthase
LNKKPDSSENKSRIRIVDPLDPDISIIRQAAEVITFGGLVVFPTRNLYGLGADAFDEDAVRQVFDTKRRPPEKPVSILIKSRKDLESLVTDIPSGAIKLMDILWPGRITLVFKARPEVPAVLTAGTGKIGIRLPAHPVAVALVNELNHPITATSANVSGMEGVHRIQDLPEAFINDVSLILDAGPLKEGKGSTVVDVTTDPIAVLREGEVPQKEIIRLRCQS